MVQPKYNPKEALERAKLLMTYDSKKTLSENRTLVKEAEYNINVNIPINNGPDVQPGMTQIPQNQVPPAQPSGGNTTTPRPRSQPKTPKTLAKKALATLKGLPKWCTKNVVTVGVCLVSVIGFGWVIYEESDINANDLLIDYFGYCEKGVPVDGVKKTVGDSAVDVESLVDTIFDALEGPGTDLAQLGIRGNYTINGLLSDFIEGKISNPKGKGFQAIDTFETFCKVKREFDKKKGLGFDDRKLLAWLMSDLNDSETYTLSTIINALVLDFQQKYKTGGNGQTTIEPGTCPSGYSTVTEIPSWVQAVTGQCLKPLLVGGKYCTILRGGVNGILVPNLTKGEDKITYIDYLQNFQIFMPSENKLSKYTWYCKNPSEPGFKMRGLKENVNEQKPKEPDDQNDKKKKTGGTKPKKDEFCPNGYKQCTGEYQKCCIADKIKQMQKCLGIAPPHEGKWGPRTDAAYKAVYGEWGSVINDNDIDAICFCPKGYNDCSGSYNKCCRSPKIKELKACLKFTTTDSDVWGIATDNELKKLRPELANGFTDEDIRRICQPGRAIKIIDPSDTNF